MAQVKAKIWLGMGILAFLMFVAFGAILPGSTSHPFWLFGGMIVALGMLYVSSKGLLNSRYESAIRRVRNQLLFAVFCLGSIPFVAFTMKLISGHGMILSYLEAYLAIGAFCLYSVGGCVLMVHGIGLILAVGWRLSTGRRLCLYSALFLVPVLITAWLVTNASLVERAILVGIVMVAVSILTFVDFRRYAVEEQESRYDPVARVVAAFLSGRS